MKELLLAIERIGAPCGGHAQVSALIELASRLGLDQSILCHDLKHLLCERIAMWLLGPVDQSLNYSERRIVVGARIAMMAQGLAPETVSELVEATVAAQSLIAQVNTSAKAGMRTVDEGFASSLLADQGYRCAVCGACLRSGVRRESERFPGGLEPLVAEQLDHELPFYIAANSETVILCQYCNLVKNDYIGIQEDGISLASNHVRSRLQRSSKRRMSFWTLYYSSKCEECESTAKDGVLLVGQRRKEHPWVPQNIKVSCLRHGPIHFEWLHIEQLRKVSAGHPPSRA